MADDMIGEDVPVSRRRKLLRAAAAALMAAGVYLLVKALGLGR